MIRLERGRTGDDPGVCFVAYLARETDETDMKIETTWCPVLRRFLQTFNDVLPDDERQLLLQHVSSSLDALQRREQAYRRAVASTEWLVRVHASAWCESLGRPNLAADLAAFRTSGSTLTDKCLDELLSPAMEATHSAFEALHQPHTAESAVIARTVTQRSAATAAAAALTPLLEDHMGDQTELGATLRTGWAAWRVGWDIIEFLAQADSDAVAPRDLGVVADGIRGDAWRLFHVLLSSGEP